VNPGVVLGGILLLGFFLRVFRLDFQSLWYDETYSVYVARGPFSGVGAVPEAEPLLHYYLLWAWGHAAGFSEFAARYLSVCAGALTMPLVYRLARAAVRNVWVALLAAGLTAISPFELGYSQEVRLHIFAGLFAAACTWMLVKATVPSAFGRQPPPRLLESVVGTPHTPAGTASLHLLEDGHLSPNHRASSPAPGRWISYGALAVAGLYTSYYLALVLAAINLPVLVMRRWSRGWLLANVAAVALAVPGITLGWSRLKAFGEPYPVLTGLLDPLRFLKHVPEVVLFANLPASAEPLAVALLAVALVGAWQVLRRRTIEGWILVCGGFGAYALIFAVPAAARISFYDRYELMALPGLLVLLAAGVWFLAARLRWMGPLLAAAVLVPTGIALVNGYTNPAYQRDDNRTALSIVKREALPDEMLIYDLRLLYTVVDYYAPNLPIPSEGLPLPKNPALPPERQFLAVTSDRAATERELDRLSQQYAGFWLLLSGDPTQWTEEWLDAHRLMVSNQWFGGTRLVHFRPLPSPAPASFQEGLRVERSFGPLTLREIEAQPLQPGASWPVSLGWETAETPSADYTISLQLFDGSGKRVAQQDSQPFQGALPTTQWQPGKAYDDVMRLELPQTLAPGIYRLAAGAYDLGGRTTLPQQPVANVTSGLRLLDGPRAASSAGWQIENWAAGPTGDGGYAVAVQGLVSSQPQADYTWFIHLVDSSGRLVAQDDHPPLTPTSRWQAGDRFLETFHLGTPPSANDTLQLGAYDAAGQRVSWATPSGSTDVLALRPA